MSEFKEKMAKQSLIIDAWLREAQEAAKSVEEIDAKVMSKKGQKQKQQQHRVGDEIAQSKLFEVGVKLDQLESLLHNPPSKPILTNEDLESRWKMLSDLKLRTRALAVSLYAMAAPTLNRQGGLPDADTKHTSRKANSYDPGQTRTSFPNDELELLKPLVYSEDATQRHMQIKSHSSYISMSLLWKVCSTICIILGAVAFLFLLSILCAVI